ncbi:MAG: type II toxin-antitoxin system HicA family toxin [Phycisphaeraceae bacterium]
MLKWLGAELSEGSGSRVRVSLRGVRAVLHRPHPSPQATRSQVRSIRTLLERAGIGPEEQ